MARRRRRRRVRPRRPAGPPGRTTTGDRCVRVCVCLDAVSFALGQPVGVDRLSLSHVHPTKMHLPQPRPPPPSYPPPPSTTPPPAPSSSRGSPSTASRSRRCPRPPCVDGACRTRSGGAWRRRRRRRRRRVRRGRRSSSRRACGRPRCVYWCVCVCFFGEGDGGGVSLVDFWGMDPPDT